MFPVADSVKLLPENDPDEIAEASSHRAGIIDCRLVEFAKGEMSD